MKSHRSRKHNRFLAVLKVSALSCCLFLLLLTVGLFFAPKPFYHEGFKNLTDISKYAASLDELTKMDSDNAVKPDFSTFYKRYQSTVSKNIKEKVLCLLNKVHLVKAPVFSASFFKSMLDNLNKTREGKGYKGPIANKITATASSKFVVWGDLQGAFHSLVRSLGKLKDLGIINEDLKILNQDHFFIFLGNVPNRSPFSMETLGLVMRLMQVNPDQVLYLKGSHETDDYWQEHTLKTELKLRASHLSSAKITIEAEMSKFFESLPTIIFLAGLQNNEFVRMAYSSRTSLPDAPFAKFLTTKHPEKVALLTWTGKTPPAEAAAQPFTIKAVVKIEKKRETYQQSDGLRLMPADMGATSWTMLSAPTLAAEMGFKFFNDTFSVIDAAEKMDDWKITIYYQDRRQKSGYLTKQFYLTSGLDGAVARPVAGAFPAPTQSAQQAVPVVPQSQPSAVLPVQTVATSTVPVAVTPQSQVVQQNPSAVVQQVSVQPVAQVPIQQSVVIPQNVQPVTQSSQVSSGGAPVVQNQPVAEVQAPRP